MMGLVLGLALGVVTVGCGPSGARDASVGLDAGRRDAGAFDAGAFDASRLDAAGLDAKVDDGGALPEAGGADAGPTGGSDAGSMDSGSDGGIDAGFDAGTDAGFDAGTDAGTDAGPPGGGCVSGATGTHVLRFRWDGTTSGSRAYVVYEANTLPDTSRWSVGAYSRSIGYSPVFRDPFLGDGGLELSGSVFIDVELSTLGLSSVRNATLSIYGRSYNTTASGSFSWMSFSGSGAAPSGSVSNVAPYRWYGANATSALPAGDGSTLLRIEAGPPSNALIVSRVEICFDAI